MVTEVAGIGATLRSAGRTCIRIFACVTKQGFGGAVNIVFVARPVSYGDAHQPLPVIGRAAEEGDGPVNQSGDAIAAERSQGDVDADTARGG